MLNHLETAIVRDPLVAGANETVLSAVEQMHDLSQHGAIGFDRGHETSTCVVIVADGQQVLGILTERDMIGLVAQQQPIAQLTLEQFLQQHRSQSANLTLPESALSDVTTAIAHFEQQQITHLPIVNAQNQLVGVLLYESLKRLRDITTHQATASLLASQQQILERIAKAEPLTEVLSALLQTMESHLAGTACSIILCRDGRLADMFAPSLPSDYIRLIPKLALPIAEGVGSCGTAAYRQELVVVTDIEHDPLWHDYKSLVLGYGLQACTSIPIFGSDRTLLGVFGIYNREKKAPDAQELESIAQAANIAGIAIERTKSTQALQQLNQELEMRVAERSAALLASEINLKRITHNLPGMVCRYVLHPDGNHEFTYASPQSRDIYELEAETILQDENHLWNRIHPDDLLIIQARIQETAITLQPTSLEFRAITPQSGLKWLQVIMQPEPQENGDVVWNGVVIDISDRKRAEFDKQRQLAILDSTSDLIGTCAPDGTILYLNRAWLNLLRQDNGKLANRIVISEQHPAWALERVVNEGIPAAIEHGTWLGETALLDGQGQEIPVSQLIISHKSSSGELEYLSTIIRDISDQKRTEQELILKRHHLEALLNNLPHIAWIKDEQSRFIAVNEPFAQACGVPAEELVGKTDFDIWPADLAQAYRDDDFQVLKSGQRKVVEEKVALANGTMGWLETIKTPFRNDRQVFAGTVGIAADITNRKTMELALKASERRYASLAAAAPVAIFRFDIPSHCIYVNEHWSQLSGRPVESALGYGWMEALHPDDREHNIAQWAEAFAQANPDNPIVISGEGRHLLPDGTTNWCYVQVAQEFDEDGNVVGYIGTLTDISDRKKAELALQESQAQFRRMTENVPGMIYRYLLHPDGRDELTYVSSQIREIFELEPSVALADVSRLWDRIHPEDLVRIADAVQESAATLDPFTSEYRLNLPQQGLRWVQNQTHTERLEDGTVVWNGVVLDTTDRKNAAIALQDLSDRLEFALKGANIGIWEWQMSDGRLLWDDRMCALYGILPEDFSGEYEDWFQHIHPDDRDRVQQAEQQAYLGAKECRVEFRIIRPDGTIRFIDSYAFNQWTAEGVIQKTIGLNIDITDRKQAEAQLQKSNEELARATRLKDEFLANMSHELRTPLNAILGMTEILQEQVFGDLNARQQKALQTIEKSSNHLLELINDILDVAKIEAGQIELSCQPTNITALCQSSLAFIKQQAFNKNIQIELAIPSALPAVTLDERRIRQVLINLLNNAVKFTPKGGKITLQVSYMSDPDHAAIPSGGVACNTLEISVMDTGIGIAPDQINRLFQPFVQVESALNRNYEGSGLGLALVKRLVELHGGQVSLMSELGVGSCFTIALPVATIGTETIAPGPLVSMNSEAIAPDCGIAPVILLAEDNEANINMFIDYLSLKGYRLVVANNGQMAIDLAKQTHPDVILIDIQMPGMDGLEVIRHIRQLPEFADTPILALTALAMSGDRERCLEAGANDYLSKPVKLLQLVNQINNYLNLN